MSNTQSTATKTVPTCICGCGLPLGGKSSYRPGHDAKHVSQLLAVVKEETKKNITTAEEFVSLVGTAAEQLTSSALRAKLNSAVVRWMYKTFDSDIAKDEKSAKKNPQGVGSTHKWTISFHPDDVTLAVSTAVYKSVGVDAQGIDAAPATAAADFEDTTAEEITELLDSSPMITECYPVKVGRWTYPARMVGTKMERNTKRDSSGEWIAYEG